MSLIKLHSLLILFGVLLMAEASYGGAQFRIMTGTKSQSFNTGGQIQVGSSPLGLITFVDFLALNKLYLSFGTSFEMNTSTLSTSGFTIYGSALYYLYGSPNPINASTGSMNMDFFYPYSIFLSGGVFQKQIRVRSEEEESTSTENLGGLQIGLGLNYNLNPKMYVTSKIQMLMSGSEDSEFSSTELYLGLGLRL